MALSERIQVFGFRQIVAYDPVTKIPYGQADIVGDCSFGRTLELISQTGGSYADPTAVDIGAATAEANLVIREKPDWLFEIFNGNAATINSAETGGSVTAIENFSGSSVVDATTGIASVGIKAGDEDKVTENHYVVEAVTATTVNVYLLNSVDFYLNQVEYANDGLPINSTPFTVLGTGGTLEIVDDNSKTLAIEFTGGSGAVAMTPGDTAVFTSRRVNNGSRSSLIGGLGENFKEFGLLLHSAKSTKGVTETLNIFRCVASGMPLTMTEKAYQEVQLPFMPVADPCNNGAIARVELIKPIVACT